MGQPGIAADYLASAAILDRGASRFWLEAGLQYKAAWDASKAVIAISEYAKASPNDLGGALLHLDNFCRGDSSYFRIADSLLLDNSTGGWNPSPAFQFLWSMGRGRWERALQALGGMDQDSTFHVRALQLAGSCVSAGRLDLVAKLRGTIRPPPVWAAAQWLPLEAHAAQTAGNRAQVRLLFEKQWSLSPTAQLAVAYARFKFDDGDFLGARAIVEQGLALDADGAHAAKLFPLAARSAMLANNTGGLDKIWSRWQKLMVHREELRSSFHFHQGRFEAMNNRMGPALEHWARAAEAGKGEEANDAIEWTALLSDVNADTSFLRQAWNAILLGERGQALKAADSLSSLAGRSYGEAINTVILWAADWYGKASADAKALDLLANSIEQCTNCERLMIQQARLLGRLGRHAAAGKAYEDFLVRFPTSILAGEAKKALRAEAKP